jgi:hypothetical protein
VCKYAGSVGQTPGASTPCASSGTIRTGFYSGSHWSSSEATATTARTTSFPYGGDVTPSKSATPYYVRPVRAF